MAVRVILACSGKTWLLTLTVSFGLAAGAFAQQTISAPVTDIDENGDAIPLTLAPMSPVAADPNSDSTPSLLSSSPTELKKLPIEALGDVEITSASRRPEDLWQTSSAVDVITAEDIEHAGVTTIPDALRLATEVQVAQIDGHTWAVSVRGFSNSISNKVQVLMDGRSLYTPLFSGVFWDVQQTFLPDLEQIEIIRGPGATLWGANAVNGVINIRTKPADQTQGFLFYGGGGFEEDGFFGARWGGKIADDTYYRVYVTHEEREGLPIQWDESEDNGQMTQGGFRIDSKLNPDDHLTLQGDFYAGNFDQLNMDNIDMDGENVLGRWTHDFTTDSSFMLQAYWDRTYRLIPSTFEEERNTGDLELQYSLRYGEHYVVMGGEYRLSHDNIGNLGPSLAFLPDSRTVHLVSGYVQDEWHIVPDKFYFTAGSKFEYNSFSGFEIQPTGRLTWMPDSNQTVWAAVSRAVRTPTRIDQNLVAPNPAFASAILIANEDFGSEDLIAYELGYRVKATSTLSFDLAGYFNDYSHLRSVEPLPNGQLTIENKLAGETYGLGLTTKWRVTDWWQLDGNLSLLHEDIHTTEGGHDISHAKGETNDPSASCNFHSGMDLPWHLRLDTYLRYVDDLPHPYTPSYVTADLRLAWAPTKNYEFAIVARNLFDEAHPEFASTTPTATREVERTVYVTFQCNF